MVTSSAVVVRPATAWDGRPAPWRSRAGAGRRRAGEDSRAGAGWRRNAHFLQQARIGERTGGSRPVDPIAGDLVAGHGRIQRGHRFLENHRDGVAAQPGERLHRPSTRQRGWSPWRSGPRRRRQSEIERPSRFCRCPELADQGDGLVGGHRQGEVAHRGTIAPRCSSLAARAHRGRYRSCGILRAQLRVDGVAQGVAQGEHRREDGETEDGEPPSGRMFSKPSRIMPPRSRSALYAEADEAERGLGADRIGHP